MNFNKTRKILILLLLITNLFLSLNIAKVGYTNYKQEKLYINSSINFLKNSSIYIDNDLFKNTEIFDTNTYVFSKISSSNIEKILGNVHSLETNIYVSDIGTGKISENGQFVISINEEYSIIKVEQLLKNAGFDLENVLIEDRIGATKYTYVLNNIPIDSLSFEVVINKNFTSIVGNFPFSNKQTEKSVKIPHLTRALLNMQNNFDEDIFITDISQKYILNDNEYIQIIPVLDITFNDRSCYYNLYDEKNIYF